MNKIDEAEEITRIAKQFVPAAIRIIGGPHVIHDSAPNDTRSHHRGSNSIDVCRSWMNGD